jgi:hypothetical protein
MGVLSGFTPRMRLGVTLGAWGLALVVLVVLAAVFSAWQPYTARAGGFRVEFPGIPLTQHQAVATPFGTVTLHAYTLVQVLHGATYAASYCVYPPAMVAQMGGSPLELMRDAAVNQTGGTVITERDVTAGAARGKDLTLREPGLGVVRLRVMVVEDRTYALMVRPVPKHGAARADRFINSFTLQPGSGK